MFRQTWMSAHPGYQLASTCMASCRLLGPLTVFPELLIKRMEANGEYFSGQGSTFLYAFLDPYNPEDQMAVFVFKENSYRISTFDIKIYTV